MRITEHFDSSEFVCPCCGGGYPDKELTDKLELLFKELNAGKIIVTSGYRCPEHSVVVGGYANDAHTRNIAADIIAYRKSGAEIPPAVVAYAAEKVGFSGIGIIDEEAVHVDVRNANNYVNSHWFGDERTGNDYIKTFADYPENKVDTNKSDMKVINAILDIDGHKYSGLLTEE